jgi:hypothetical protein
VALRETARQRAPLTITWSTAEEPSTKAVLLCCRAMLPPQRVRALAVLLAPTAAAVVLDVVTRGGRLVATPSYLGSVLLSAALWCGPLWVAAKWRAATTRAATPGAPTSRATPWRAASVAVLALLVFPFSVFAYGGQALYYRVFHAYIARDTVRFGFALRSTLLAWLEQLGGAWSFVLLGGLGGALALGFVSLVRRWPPIIEGRARALPALAFALALAALWFDALETRAEQHATPDVCFAHGVVHAVRERLASGRARAGISVRTPASLPPLPRAERRPNVLVVLTESVRADALCSEPSPSCRSTFLDAVAPERRALGGLTTTSPGTVTACVVLWTGLPVDADFTTMHAAPTLWELARAVGYRTAYVSAQNLKDADFGPYLRHAGIDVRVTGTELGGVTSELIGAPDERATARTLDFVRAVPAGTPWLAMTHLSNTHVPYRVADELQPNVPHSAIAIGGVERNHNHYRNSVLLQERTVASLVRELRAMPAWDDTVVLFLSDHGEQFAEHGSLYHLHSLFEEEVRIPGFVVGGARALGGAQLEALATFAGQRTYTHDVNATVLDLLGLWDVRGSLPFAERMPGRSLLRARPDGEERPALLAIPSAVWDSDVPLRGAVLGNHVLVEATGGRRSCYDLARDPGEQSPLPAEACGALGAALR